MGVTLGPVRVMEVGVTVKFYAEKVCNIMYIELLVVYVRTKLM